MAGSSQSRAPESDLVDVPKETFETIKNIIQSTFDPSQVGEGRDAADLDHCGVSIVDIKRVKNKSVYAAYRDFRQKLIEKNSNVDVERIRDFPPTIEQFEKSKRRVKLNEVYLLHGTNEDSARDIRQNGFECTNPKNLFGNGFYFAEKFTKADQYTEAKKWKQSPCMKCKCRQKKCEHGWKKRYDSVLGSGDDMLFREFVVYDSEQCFPEFVITYKREGGWNPVR